MPAAIEVEVGQRFGDWVAIGEPYRRQGSGRYPRRYVSCRCVCGYEGAVQVSKLATGASAGCGPWCPTRGPQPGDLFARWTVMSQVWTDDRGRRRIRARCGCGAEREIDAHMLTRGHSTQCRSCARRAERTIHGQSDSPAYNSWKSMLHRCFNDTDPAWADYGGRGITVWEAWRSPYFGGREGGFERFLADMGDRPEGRTLDRIDPDGDYESANCRWATLAEQYANRRQGGTPA